MRRPICEHGMFGGQRCRKRATKAVQFQVEFGRRVCMNGPDQVAWDTRVQMRCDLHSDIENKTGEVPIATWLKACQDAATGGTDESQ